jgi:hypothetical protein
MRKIYILLLCLISAYTIYAQDYQLLKVKEEYDLFSNLMLSSYAPYNKIYSKNFNTTRTKSDTNTITTFGEGIANIMESYITMYETTKDKAYLYKFIFQSLCLIEERPDYSIDSTQAPRWSFDPMIYLDGIILAALSRFVYFIEFEEPTIKEEHIYQFDELKPEIYKPQSSYCNRFDIFFNTFGQYARWLADRVIETLNWYINNGYWNDNCAFTKFPNINDAAEINMQAGFSRALLFMGLYTNESSYLEKAKIIDNLLKSEIKFFDVCKLKNYNSPLFILTNDNSYWWYHSGWYIPHQHCIVRSKSINGYTKYIEDISHAVPVVELLIDYYLFLPNTKLKADDMIRLRNMFTKHIYDGKGEFRRSVMGTDGPVYPQYRLDYAALNYIPLYIYDGADTTATEPNVYEIVLNFYKKNIANNSKIPKMPYFNGGFSIKGQAEIVQAVWKKEIYNLTLYNRRLVYNQNFYAKGTLTIAPQQYDYIHRYNDKSFAEPLITDNSFIVEAGIIVNMSAGDKIILKPGTYIKEGSHFRAFVE